MVSINYSAREVCCKIVYYGPGLSGKTTNLQYVHAKVPQNSRGKLISLATEADRTLYFDFLPINIGTINGFQAKFQLYTVPGQVYYNATRKLVLRGVDGLVFVADSQADKMDDNIESLMNLEENLREYGYDPAELPIVIQYNKRDLPGVLSVDELNQRLNTHRWPHFEASAPNGHGVFDTLKLIIKLVLDKAKQAGSNRPVAPSVTAVQPVEPPAPPPVYQPYPEAARPAAQPVEQPVAAHIQQPIPSAPTYQPQVEPQPTRQSAAANATRPITIPSVPASEPSYRPYPGSNRTGGIAVAPAPFPQTLPSTLPGDSVDLTQESGTHDSVGSAGLEDTSRGHSPQMAPSMKKAEAKKRGFFKRLFGIR